MAVSRKRVRSLACLLSIAAVAMSFAMPALARNDAGGEDLDVISTAWRPGPGSAAPVMLRGSRGGVGFKSSATSTARRCYWDMDVELDLSGREIFEVDLLLTGMQSLGEISLHFRSGDGWYSATRPIGVSNTQVVQFDRDDFGREGTSAGWDKIDRIRISLWRSDPGAVGFHLYRITASNPKVILLKDGNEGKSDPLAAKCVAQVEEWLMDIGVSARTVYQSRLRRDDLVGRHLVVLPYNPRLGKREVGLLENFIADGGKLFVFYNDNPQLARAMGVGIGAFTTAPEHYPWERIEFAESRDSAFPAVVFQRATSVVPVYPRDGGGRVIASWSGLPANGQTPPALVESPAGLWMTQIPRRFHAVAKRQMMAAAVARLAPELGLRIARRMIVFAGQVDSFHNVPEASLALRRKAAADGAPAAVGECINRADAGYRAAQAAITAKKNQRALAAAIGVRAELERAYALLYAVAPGPELRGVWDHHGLGLYPGDWERTCRLLAASGINAIFPNMLNDGYAHYDSSLLHHSPAVKNFGDQIDQCIAAAERFGIEVHIWKVCWKLDGAPAGFIGRMEREGRLQIDADGKVLPWLNPAHPENRRMAIENIGELVKKYDIDGIHLDYIRYSGPTVDCSPYSRSAFQTVLGREIQNWPKDILPGGVLHERYNRWKVEQISTFVREVHARIKALDPAVKLSAAVYGGYPECVRSVSQDWKAWLDDGIVDFLTPMDYTDSIEFFAELLESHSRIPESKGRIYPGIGVTSSQSSLAPSDVIEQIGLIRAQGFGGYLLFDLDTELAEVVLPALRTK